MTLFEQILSEQGLLLEMTNDQNIIKAIRKALRVRMTYHDGEWDRKGKKERYILPVAYGTNDKGQAYVRAYESAGSTKRGLKQTDITPNGNPWKLFKVSNIVSWNVGDRSFKNMKDFLFDEGLNPKGEDKAIPNMIALVPFFGNPDGKPVSQTVQQPQEPTEPTQPTPTEPQVPQEPMEPQTIEPVQEPSVDNVAGQSSTG